MNKLHQLKQLPEEDLNALIRGSAFLMGVRFFLLALGLRGTLRIGSSAPLQETVII